METRTIAVTNQKGGVAKTTTVVNLGACLAQLDRKVLLIDLDPQGNLSSWLGINIHNLDKSVYDIFLGRVEINHALIDSCVAGMHIIPANVLLANVERVFVNQHDRERILQKRLASIINNLYDYILFDCPPSLGLITLNALTLVKEVFIPIETKVLSLNGLITLINTVQLIRNNLNHVLEVTGIIACKFDKRTNLSKEVVDKIKDRFGKKVFSTIIRESTKLAECPISGLPITLYAPDSHGAHDYLSLAKEVIEGEVK